MKKKPNFLVILADDMGLGKTAQVLALLQQQAPWLEVDGEMHGDVALDGAAREIVRDYERIRAAERAGRGRRARCRWQCCRPWR